LVLLPLLLLLVVLSLLWLLWLLLLLLVAGIPFLSSLLMATGQAVIVQSGSGKL
jgi:hypothetical protein